MIYFNDTKDEFLDFFINSITEFTEKEGKPIGIGVSLNKASSEISLHYNVKNEIDKKGKSIDQFEYIRYDITKYIIGQPGNITSSNSSNQIDLWKRIRNVTKEIELPTVLYHIEDKNQFDLPIEHETEIFGRAVIKYFRDEIMDYHNSHIDRFANKTIDEVKSEFRDHWLKETRQEQLKNAAFFGNLNKEQLDFLNDYVLRILDNTVFNVMRALDEKTGHEESQINVDVKGIKVTELNLIGNGNLSGEYLDWIERFSNFKEFQT